ncbi:MAG: helix-turn-helix domain-containing protein [Patescibacteria group bacterium]
MKEISPILHALGFLESEITTYLAALQNGPSTVLELTKVTNLSRQATYGVIDELTSRGLMSSMLRGKKKYYLAEQPERLLSYAQRKEVELKDQVADLEGLLPELKLKVSGTRPVVRLFEGKEGFLAMYEEMRQSKCKQMHEMYDLEAKRMFIPPGTLHNTLKSLKNIGTRITALYTHEPMRKSLSPETYILPEEFRGFKSAINVYDDKIACFSFEGKLHSVVIENHAIADAFRVLFELARRELDRENARAPYVDQPEDTSDGVGE